MSDETNRTDPNAAATLTYGQALTRLKEVTALIENPAVDIDKLEGLVQEAVGLVATCRAKLTGTQSSVEQALTGLNPESNEAGKSSVAQPVQTISSPATKPAIESDSELDEKDPFADE
jgi:exodeoxyribonuclease VII small subunit